MSNEKQIAYDTMIKRNLYWSRLVIRNFEEFSDSLIARATDIIQQHGRRYG